VGVLPYKGFLKDKFDILHLKPSFKIVSDEIERLRLKFWHKLLSQEFSFSVVVVENTELVL